MDNIAYIYVYIPIQRKWAFMGLKEASDYHLETWRAANGVTYTLDAYYYSEWGVNEQIKAFDRCIMKECHQTGPLLYRLVADERDVCAIKKPFLSRHLEIHYYDKNEVKSYKTIQENLSFEALKQEIYSLLDIEVHQCTIHHVVYWH